MAAPSVFHHLRVHRGALCLVLALSVLAGPARAQRGTHPLALYPAINEAGEAAAYTSVDQAVAEAAVAAGMVNALPAEAVAQKIAERLTAGEPCRADQLACFAEIGVELGVDLVLVPQVRTADAGMLFSCLLIDSWKASVVDQAASGPHGDYESFLLGVREVTAALLEPTETGGLLMVLSSPEGAEIYVDGRRLGRTPLADPLGPLAAGRHQLELRAAGHRTRIVAVELQDRHTARVELELDPLRPPPETPVATAPPPPAAPPLAAATEPDDDDDSLVWAGAATLGAGALLTVGFAITAVTGELSYRIARGWQPDPGDSALLVQRRDELATGQALLITGLIGSALGTATMLGGGGLLVAGSTK